MAIKIGLYGIAGVYNLGCEAILRGIYTSYRNRLGDVEWVYFSQNAEDDAKRLKDLPIVVRQTKRKYILIKRILNKIFDVLHIDYQIPHDDYRSIINECDIIISIGGDIYTIPNYLRKNSKYSYHNRMVDFGDKALKRGKKVIVYGASIGPFGTYDKAVEYYKNHLKKVNQIFAREEGTITYLKEIGVKDNVSFMPDPAFSLRGQCVKQKKEKNLIGINLSGLSLLETYGDVSSETIKKLVNVIVKIMDTTKCKVIFIPHVFSKYEVDNDLIILSKIMSCIPDKYKEDILISSASTFLTAKEDLSKCSIVIAARMHCAINALSEEVPTILLSYSCKAKGICEFVYNSTHWLYDIKNINDNSFVQLVVEMLSCRNQLSKEIKDRLDQKLDGTLYEKELQKMEDLIYVTRGSNV